MKELANFAEGRLHHRGESSQEGASSVLSGSCWSRMGHFSRGCVLTERLQGIRGRTAVGAGGGSLPAHPLPVSFMPAGADARVVTWHPPELALHASSPASSTVAGGRALSCLVFTSVFPS